MPLEESRIELINKILFAVSQDEVKSLIDATINTLEQNNLNDYVILRFSEKMIFNLELFNPMKKDAQQWSNIQIAKIIFNRIRNRLKTPSIKFHINVTK